MIPDVQALRELAFDLSRLADHAAAQRKEHNMGENSAMEMAYRDSAKRLLALLPSETPAAPSVFERVRRAMGYSPSGGSGQ